MKKQLSWAAALLMACSVPCTALAVGSGEASEATVTGKYQSGGESSVVYSVDITWENLDFTYTDAFQGTWNAGTHQYEGGTPAGWAPANAKITVTNHSNAEITAAYSYTAMPGYESVSLVPSEPMITVDSADNGQEGQPGTAVEETVTVTPQGSLPKNTNGEIGTITITVN